MKKIISILILTLMLFACSSGSSSVETGEIGRETETTVDTRNPREIIREDLPEIDFEGYEFRIMVADADTFSFDVFAIEETGEKLNDATYRRDQRVSERFGVTIVYYQAGARGELGNKAYASIMAGDDTFDVIKVVPWSADKLAKEDMFLSWNEIPYVDLDKPWWNQSIRYQLAVGDRTLWMNSDMSVNDYASAQCYLFNKNLFDSFDFEYPYQLVKDFKWTRETLEGYIKVAPIDLNGDGEFKLDDDMFGISMHAHGMANFVYMWSSQVMSKDKDNLPYLNLNTERTVAIINQVYEWVYEKKHINIHSDVVIITPPAINAFQASRLLLMPTMIGDVKVMRDMEADFGILPFPMWDENQDHYRHYANPSTTYLAIPYIAPNIERTGIVMEALSAEGYRTIIPEYYDVVLKVRDTRDDESELSIDLIQKSIFFDISHFYGGSLGSYSDFPVAILYNSKSNDFASYYAKKENAALLEVEKFIELMTK
ncbi:MAG: hypothetical protein FWF15_04745 [Oscillospiraceae bacterium]|nr:hypothetical protein [Oscillospiraceae bacterium]